MANRVLTWLKKYGLTILKDAVIVLGIGSQATTALAPNNPQATAAADTLTKIAGIVTSVETSAAAAEASGASLTSEQKLAAAAALVNQELQAWFAANLPGTPKVANQTQWENGVTAITNGVVALLNSAEPNVATTPGVPGSVVPVAPAPATPSAK